MHLHLIPKIIEMGTLVLANGLPGLPRPKLFQKPIFILSPPRSGSSLLHSMMHQAFGDLWGCKREADGPWWKTFPYKNQRTTTDYIPASDMDDKAARSVRLGCLQDALSRPRHWHFRARDFLGWGEGARYLDKTIANAFHLEVMDRVFPDFLAIYLIRDPKTNFASMLESWQSEKSWKRDLWLDGVKSPETWCFPIPPGWENVQNRSVEKRCAWSLLKHHENIIRWTDSNPERVLTIRYEDLLENPKQNFKRIESFCGLHRVATEEGIRQMLGQLSWSTVTAPSPDKWRQYQKEIEENSDELARVRELLAHSRCGGISYSP